MSLSIELSGDRSTFRPGSIVSGIVKLTSKTDESISAVTICFRGRCKVKLRSSEHYTTRSYRSSGIYFREERLLYDKGKFTHKAGTYSWPFTFTIPKHGQTQIAANASPSRPKRQLDNMGMMKLDVEANPRYDFFTPRSPWRGSQDLRPHPLLDSFSYVHSRWPLDWEARIEYTLFATLKRPPSSYLFPAKDLEARRNIALKSSAPANLSDLLQQRQSKVLTQVVSTPHFLSNIERRMSLMDRTQSLFRSGPSSKFSFVLSVTTEINVKSGPGPIFVLQVSVPDQTQNLGPIQLRSLSLNFVMNTAVRDNALTALEQTAEILETVGIARKKGLEIEVPDQIPVFVDIGQNIPNELVPSFSTFNIHRGYRLAFDLKLEHGGQTVTISDDSIKIVVLPAADEEIVLGAAPDYEPSDSVLATVESQHIDSMASEKKDEKADTGPPPPPEDDHEQLPAYQP